MSYLQQYAPVIEQYSIDEVFCDMTGTEKLYGNPVDFAHRLKNIIKTVIINNTTTPTSLRKN